MAMYLFDDVSDQYDVAITWFVPNSYQTVYTLDKVNAKHKVMWIHMDVKMDKMPFDAQDYFIRYDKIFCVSNACLNSFIEIYPDCIGKVEIYYNLLNVNEIKRLACERCDIDDVKAFKIVTCGRIAVEKQPMYAIEIMQNLRKYGYDNVVWYFIGDGPLKIEMEQAIRKNELEDSIVLCGTKVNPYPYVKNADLYVQMSRHESYCLTLAEAQCLKIPAVTTNFKSAYEIVDDTKTGYIVENNWKEIYDKIRELLDSEAEYMKMKESLSSYVLTAKGSVDRIVEYIKKVG